MKLERIQFIIYEKVNLSKIIFTSRSLIISSKRLIDKSKLFYKTTRRRF